MTYNGKHFLKKKLVTKLAFKSLNCDRGVLWLQKPQPPIISLPLQKYYEWIKPRSAQMREKSKVFREWLDLFMEKKKKGLKHSYF